MERNPENEPVPGALLFRAEASLLYFNVDSVREAVWSRLRGEQTPVRLVVCDLSASPYVDMAGAEMLAELHGELQQQGIHFQVVEARSKVRDMLRLEGLEEQLGHISRRATLAQAVAEFLGARAEPLP
jgi:MFS superfamily sulfate permease-like transporter